MSEDTYKLLARDEDDFSSKHDDEDEAADTGLGEYDEEEEEITISVTSDDDEEVDEDEGDEAEDEGDDVEPGEEADVVGESSVGRALGTSAHDASRNASRAAAKKTPA